MSKTDQMCLTEFGTVAIDDDGVSITCFDAENANNRQLAIMACCWAIGELQREMLLLLEGGSIAGQVTVDGDRV